MKNNTRGRNFIITDEVYKQLKTIAAKENTTIGGAVSILINNYDKTANLPVKHFGDKGGNLL